MTRLVRRPRSARSLQVGEMKDSRSAASRGFRPIVIETKCIDRRQSGEQIERRRRIWRRPKGRRHRSVITGSGARGSLLLASTPELGGGHKAHRGACRAGAAPFTVRPVTWRPSVRSVHLPRWPGVLGQSAARPVTERIEPGRLGLRLHLAQCRQGDPARATARRRFRGLPRLPRTAPGGPVPSRCGTSPHLLGGEGQEGQQTKVSTAIARVARASGRRRQSCRPLSVLTS